MQLVVSRVGLASAHGRLLRRYGDGNGRAGYGGGAWRPLDRVARSVSSRLAGRAVGRRQQPGGVGVPAHPEAEAGLQVRERLLGPDVRDDLGAVRRAERAPDDRPLEHRVLDGHRDARAVGRRRLREAQPLGPDHDGGRSARAAAPGRPRGTGTARGSRPP